MGKFGESDRGPEPSFLEQARVRAQRLTERALADEADLTRAQRETSGAAFNGLNAETLRQGAALLHNVSDSTQALIERITTALEADRSV